MDTSLQCVLSERDGLLVVFTLERLCLLEESLRSRYVNGLKVAFPAKHRARGNRNERPKSEVQCRITNNRFYSSL